ncbi:MAG: ABC transporter permease [Muribaculaceae bacterium]|nr:ABC transporter permease [Muribaculaceae bacterium]
MNSPLSIIVSREYLERVKRKSFIITTILMPLFMLGLMVVPALIAMVSSPDEQRIAVIDNSGLLAARLQNSGEVSFTTVGMDLDAAKADEQYYGVLEIGSDVVDNPSDVRLYTHGPASMMVEQFISGQLESGIESIRLGRYNIDNLEQILNSVHAKVALSTMRIDKADEETSSGLSYGMGLAMAFILYMIILMYGQMVMTSIIEEKNNRVLEIVVSSVKPSVLMAGKIIGVGLVALTQILIWAAIVLSFTVWAMPAIIGSLAGVDSDFAGVLSQLGDAGYVAMLFVYMILFLVGGYLFYSSIYAAIGSAVDNIQDASQLQMVAVLPIIIGFVLAPSVINNPSSGAAFWGSIVPFTSPMVMMARIPFGIPLWEILVSLVLLYASSVALIWLAAKIYRVGIFMYGKKPTFGELLRWARYK